MALAGLVFSLITDTMRMNRIDGWLNLEQHRQGVGYQAWQAMLALGSGGAFGRGLGNGRQKHGFVPEHHTDFIYSIIGEELGLMGWRVTAVRFFSGHGSKTSFFGNILPFSEFI